MSGGTLLVAFVLASAPAGAATISITSGASSYNYGAAAGEANALRVSFDGSEYTFDDSAPITIGPSAASYCTQLADNSVRCTKDRPGILAAERLFVRLTPPGDLAPNSFRYTGPPPGSPTLDDLDLAGGNSADDFGGTPGDDEIQTGGDGGGPDVADGGEGPDELLGTGNGTFIGGPGNDSIDTRNSGPDDQALHGGDGDDALSTWIGSDALFGGEGNDTLDTAADPTGDLLDGGPGNDFLLERYSVEGFASECPLEDFPPGGDTNIGGPGADRVLDDCGVNDSFRLADGEPDEWLCFSRAGVLELDSVDSLIKTSSPRPCLEGPETELTSKMPKKTKSDVAVFEFEVPIDGGHATGFECQLDKKPFKACDSPKKYTKLKRGRHSFAVRALNSGVGPDPTPATESWKIKKKLKQG